tara:strand:+ start:746 stop:973 length:228 start_codon:yes stop_codon:yes gene_type:complete
MINYKINHPEIVHPLDYHKMGFTRVVKEHFGMKMVSGRALLDFKTYLSSVTSSSLRVIPSSPQLASACVSVSLFH